MLTMLLTLSAFAADPIRLDVLADGIRLGGPEAPTWRLLADAGPILPVPGPYDVHLAADARIESVQLALTLLSLRDASTMTLHAADGGALGPFAVAPASPPEIPRVEGVGARLFIELRPPSDTGPWLARVEPYAWVGEARSFVHATVPIDCATLADPIPAEMCHPSAKPHADAWLAAADGTCPHADLDALLTAAVRLGFGAADTPLLLEVHDDDDLGTLLDALRRIHADGLVAQLVSGTPTELPPQACRPTVEARADVDALRGGFAALPPDDRRRALVLGARDRALIQNAIQAHTADIRACYDKGLAHAPTMGGKVVVKFVIAGNGRVQSAEITTNELSDAEVGARVGECIRAAFLRIPFPEVMGGGIAIVKFPFVFTPG